MKSLPPRSLFFSTCLASLSWAFPLLALAEEAIEPESWNLEQPVLSAGKLFSSPPLMEEVSPGFYSWYHRSYFNTDLLFGTIIPFEDEEDFDPGFMVTMRFEARVYRNLRLGFEFSGGFHDIESDRSKGELLDSGTMNRAYILFPISYDVPLGGRRENPLSLRFAIAPGIQVASPHLDSENDILIFPGDVSVEADDIVAFDLRARITLYVPLDYFFPSWSFVADVSYDWAMGTARVRVVELNDGTATVLRDRDTIDLSSLNLLVGFAFVF